MLRIKKLFIIVIIILSLSFLFCGCFSKIIVLPNNDAIGESQIFEKEGFKITLTDHFIEKESEIGFYAYYVSNFCGVTVSKEDFSSQEGLADYSLEEYLENAIYNNGHKDVKPQNKDDLWFYVRDANGTRSYVFAFKGSDSFWAVQFLCFPSDAPKYEDLFFLLANSVEVE